MKQQNKKEYKTCIRCNKTKPISEFGKNKSKKDNLNPYCKGCIRERQQKWRKENPEKSKKYYREHYKQNKNKISKRKRKYRIKNKNKLNEQKKKYRKENKEYFKEYQRRYRKENKEYYKEYQKKYWKENKEYFKKQARKWREKNKEYSLKYKRKYYKNKRETNSLYKLKCRIRSSIWDSLNRRGYTKKSRTYEILDIKLDDLYKWLNGKASNGLNINIDETHLDHVVPINLAKTKNELLLLSHYSNYQLLSINDNLLKKDSYIYKYNLNRTLQHHPNPEIIQDIVDRSNIEIK